MLLDVDQPTSNLLEEHRALSIEAWRTVAEPPLDIAGRVRPGSEGIQRPLRRDGQSHRTDAETAVGLRNSSFHGRLCGLIKGASRGLQVQDQSLQVVPATLIGDTLKNAILVLDAGLLFVAKNGGGMAVQRLDVASQGLHHLHGLDVVHRIHGDGKFSGLLKRFRTRSRGRLSCLVASRLHIGLIAGFLLLAHVRSSRSWALQVHDGILGAVNFESTGGDMQRHAVFWKSVAGLVLTEDDLGEHRALRLPLANDPHVLLALDDGPLRLAEVVQAAGEDHVQAVDEGI